MRDAAASADLSQMLAVLVVAEWSYLSWGERVTVREGLLLYLICIRERIAFTAMILSSVAKVLMKLPELIIIQFAAGLLVLGYALLWSMAFFELNSLVAHKECATPRRRNPDPSPMQ